MNNIRLYQYFKLSENEMLYYINVFQFVKASDSIGKYKGQKLTSLTFDDVANIKESAKNSDFITVFFIVFGIPEKKLIRIRVREFFMALSWFRIELDKLIKGEEHLLSEEDPQMVEAGSERLNKFRELNILIPLSKEYGMTIETIALWTYQTVFNIMYFDKISRDIEREHSKIMEAKYKK